MRDMNPIKTDFAEQEIEFLAVNIFEETDAARSFIDNCGLDYRWVRGDDSVVETLGIEGVPLVIVLDRAGNVAWYSGMLTPLRGGSDLRRVLERLTAG
jgi:hypothetical protein